MTYMNRRIFLRGLGGATVAAPFLSSVAERSARAAGLAASGPPRRLVLYFTHYGCITDRWFPTTSHGPLTAANFTGKSTEMLGEFASKMLVPRGIRAMNQWDSSGRLGQQNDPHTQVTGSYFTCVPVAPDGSCSGNANNCIIPDSNQAKNNARPIGRSIDHIAAEQLNQNGDPTPLVLKIGGSRDNDMSEISYSAPDTPFAGQGSVGAVFNTLTDLFGGTSMTPDTYQVARGKSVIDIVADDLSTLKRFDMSQADRQKLDAWTELLHSTGNAVAGQECTQATADALGLPGGGGGGGGGGPGGQDITSPEVTDLMMNLAVLALLCDANRVVLMKYPPNYLFSGLGHGTEHHGLSHRIGSAFMGGGCEGGVIDALTEIDRFHAEKFAHLVRTMDSFNEGDGTLLDNTATVWFQELSDGNAHNLNNMPIMQVGGCGGYFKVGQAVNVEDGSATLSQGNSAGDCDDGNTEAINQGSHPAGTPNDVANQPINKYFCNLLNAVGVKANAEGYPELGGTEEVRRFGKFDDSSLFKGGIDRPSEFVNEGEFAELKA